MTESEIDDVVKRVADMGGLPARLESFRLAVRAAEARGWRRGMEEAAKIADNFNSFSESGNPWKYPTEITEAIRSRLIKDAKEQ